MLFKRPFCYLIFLPMLSIAAGAALGAAGLTAADMEPVRGDKAVYRVLEESAMIFEGTPVHMSSKGSGFHSSEVLAADKSGRATVYLNLSTHSIKRVQSTSENASATTTYTLETCRMNPKGIFIESSLGFENGEENSVDVGQRVLQMRLPCAIGTSWRVGRLSYKDGFNFRPESQATDYETVEVPGGTFENCVKVVSTCPQGIEGYLDQEGQRLQILSSQLEISSWYYPRIGIVKETTRSMMRLQPEGQEHAAILRMDTTTNMELTEYKLGK